MPGWFPSHHFHCVLFFTENAWQHFYEETKNKTNGKKTFSIVWQRNNVWESDAVGRQQDSLMRDSTAVTCLINHGNKIILILDSGLQFGREMTLIKYNTIKLRCGSITGGKTTFIYDTYTWLWYQQSSLMCICLIEWLKLVDHFVFH